MWRHLGSNALTLFLVLLLVSALSVEFGRQRFNGPGPLAEPILFEIQAGSGINSVARSLVAENAISSSIIFRIGAQYLNTDRNIRFGAYEIPAGASMAEILEQITRPGATMSRYVVVYRLSAVGARTILTERIPSSRQLEVVVEYSAGDPVPEDYEMVTDTSSSLQYRVAVPEGLTSWQIVEGLKHSEFLTGDIDGVPSEGSLAPDTYDVSSASTREALLERMLEAQERALEEEWEDRVDDLPIDSREQALILASIIEKETGVAEERDLVSSVFVNRLNIGMPLQADPTVIYALTGGKQELDRQLLRKDLKFESPYNTYLNKGLPPSPIANPGRDAIRAALQPADTKFLYFVADGSGGHAFATNYEDHKKNVRKWQEIKGN